MKLLNDNLLIQPVKSNETESGIILSQKEERFLTGLVILSGDKAAAKPGECVKYYRESGHPIKYDGKDCLLVCEDVDVDHVL